MKITALEPQANNAERINLYVDGRFLLGVSVAVVLQMKLELEQELSPEQLEQLRGEEALQQAINAPIITSRTGRGAARRCAVTCAKSRPRPRLSMPRWSD